MQFDSGLILSIDRYVWLDIRLFLKIKIHKHKMSLPRHWCSYMKPKMHLMAP